MLLISVKPFFCEEVIVIRAEKMILRNIILGVLFVGAILSCVLCVHRIWLENTLVTVEEFYSQGIISVVIIVLAAAEIIYFIFALARVYKRAEKREEDLHQTVYMYDVQKILFDAYKEPENINVALNKVSEMLGAEAAFLFNVEGKYIKKIYVSGNKQAEWLNTLEVINTNKWKILFRNRLEKGESILYCQDKSNNLCTDETQLLNDNGVSSIMLSPVLDSNNCLVGVLGGINMSKKWSNALLLECVSINFLMAIKNIESYSMICEMGTVDTLTGLKNINSYQYALMGYSLMELRSLCCIFIDANRLHEINNLLGHDTGDEMLKYISNSIKSVFGGQDAYRIGGDEFVIFIRDMSKENVDKNIALLRKRIADEECEISLGVAWLGENTNYIDKLASEAERNMYEEKYMLYGNKGNGDKIRSLNQKLEKILIEKKDADNFLSIISVYFMGVYMVDLSNDDTRVIYTPPVFEKILEEYDYKFKPTMLKHINTYVHTEDREAFIEFLNYNFIDNELYENRVPEYHYRKPDGTNVMLRIYRSKNFGDNIKETYWLFEEYH